MRPLAADAFQQRLNSGCSMTNSSAVMKEGVTWGFVTGIPCREYSLSSDKCHGKLTCISGFIAQRRVSKMGGGGITAVSGSGLRQYSTKMRAFRVLRCILDFRRIFLIPIIMSWYVAFYGAFSTTCTHGVGPKIGGSCATTPRQAERRIVRRFFQRDYPYAWNGGRVAYDVAK